MKRAKKGPTQLQDLHDLKLLAVETTRPLQLMPFPHLYTTNRLALTMTSIEELTNTSDPDAQLWLASEVLDCNVFPTTSKTGAAIKAWFNDVLKENELPHEMVAGVTPDGAADGQCGLSQIEDIADKVDTCQLHVLQRGVLFSAGLAGATTKNADGKSLLRKHNRAVMLSHQSLATGKSIQAAQVAAKVLEHKLLKLVGTATTRWGNQHCKLNVNCTLRGAIDPAIDKFKRENRHNKEAIVESNESEEGSKVAMPTPVLTSSLALICTPFETWYAQVGRAVPATELGLDNDDWEQSQDFGAFLSYPLTSRIRLRSAARAPAPRA